MDETSSPAGMAKTIVVGLEGVHIEQKQRKRLPIADGALQFLIKFVLEAR
jgi:hypothetical protein